jgi:hypothetical protein
LEDEIPKKRLSSELKPKASLGNQVTKRTKRDSSCVDSLKDELEKEID